MFRILNFGLCVLFEIWKFGFWIFCYLGLMSLWAGKVKISWAMA